MRCREKKGGKREKEHEDKLQVMRERTSASQFAPKRSPSLSVCLEEYMF